MKTVLLRNVGAGCVGNSPVFWREGGCGYTPWIDEAKRWTEAEADAQIRSCQGTHRFEKIDLATVETLAKRTIDVQDLPKQVTAET